MAKVEEYCEVRTTGGKFRDWITVAVAQSFTGESWIRNFRLVVAEPSLKSLLLKPEDRVDIALAGEVVISGGKITDRQVALDANRHAVQVDGVSKAGAIFHTSVDVPGGQFRGYPLASMARAILKPYGVGFRVENGPEGHDMPFPNVAVRHGESAFTFLHRLCQQRGLWMRTEPNGDIVAGVKSDGKTVVFEEGRNILSANCHISTPWVQEVVMTSQQAGSDSLFGKKAAEVQSKATVSTGEPGHKRIKLNEMPASDRELQLRTNMEVAAIQAALMRVSITYKGWLKPDVGGLWDLTDKATVRSKTLFPTSDGVMQLRVGGVVYSQDAQAGTTTTVELMNERAFQQKYPNVEEPSPYAPPTTPAEPQQPK